MSDINIEATGEIREDDIKISLKAEGVSAVVEIGKDVFSSEEGINELVRFIDSIPENLEQVMEALVEVVESE